jgi:hypothetical protein
MSKNMKGEILKVVDWNVEKFISGFIVRSLNKKNSDG